MAEQEIAKHVIDLTKILEASIPAAITAVTGLIGGWLAGFNKGKKDALETNVVTRLQVLENKVETINLNQSATAQSGTTNVYVNSHPQLVPQSVSQPSAQTPIASLEVVKQ